ncbi:MAG: hypothetical protein R2939_20270 [Kofleriaceae bacterium]
MADASLEPQARLYVLLARRAARAVIVRRGPSKQVALLTWDTRSDEIVCGQWLKGRIYERRCDLSPDGELLVYFAATWKARHAHGSWTAVSRPPWLRALALWPKGDAWGGGGLWSRDRALALHHPAHQLERESGARALPRKLVVTRLPWGGAGEDDPILHERLVRDGWTLAQATRHSHFRWGDDPTFVLEPPTVYTAAQDLKVSLRLTRTGHGAARRRVARRARAPRRRRALAARSAPSTGSTGTRATRFVVVERRAVVAAADRRRRPRRRRPSPGRRPSPAALLRAHRAADRRALAVGARSPRGEPRHRLASSQRAAPCLVLSQRAAPCLSVLWRPPGPVTS